jgi:hypothetical protein
MIQAQATDERIDKDHYGTFQIEVYGRLAGVTSFDGAERLANLHFAWLPRGFPEDRCKKLLETMQPYADISGK